MSRGSVEITAESFETIVTRIQPLRFPIPMRELIHSPGGAEYFWKLLQFIFPLDNPADFPALGSVGSRPEERSAVLRYIRTAQDLAVSTVLNSSANATMKIDRESDKITIITEDFPARDAAIGFTTMFRQCHSHDEGASFTRVNNIIGKVNKLVGDNKYEQRRRMLNVWRSAHGRLKASSIIELVDEKLVALGIRPAGYTPSVHNLNPDQLISLYEYGDLIHWGRQRDELAAFGADSLGAARELDFLKVAVGLTHFYIGFATLAQAALSD